MAAFLKAGLEVSAPTKGRGGNHTKGIMPSKLQDGLLRALVTINGTTASCATSPTHHHFVHGLTRPCTVAQHAHEFFLGMVEATGGGNLTREDVSLKTFAWVIRTTFGNFSKRDPDKGNVQEVPILFRSW